MDLNSMPVDPQKLYTILLNHFGDQKWWPYDPEYHKINSSDPRFEIMVGAILTQNTAWPNVEKALFNLKKNKSLTVKTIVEMPVEKLKLMIQPSGFFNQKSTRLKVLADHVYEKYDNSLDNFFKRDLQEIRDELLSLNGIGPETADSMILYAGNLPIFVVDAYTKRICKRIPIKINDESYDEIQQYFESELSKNLTDKNTVSAYKELHALIVELAKNYCKTKPSCSNCPLKQYCRFKLI